MRALLLDLVGLGGAGGGASGGASLYAEHGAVTGQTAQEGHHVEQGAHVGRLLLHPDDLLGVGVLVEGRLQFNFGPWVELLDEKDTDGHVFALCTLDAEVVADLSGADEEAARVFDVVVGQDVFEGGLAELGDGGETRRDGGACTWE